MTGAIECRYYGRDFTADEMALLRALIAADPQPTRAALSREFCRRIGWFKPDGGLKDMMAKVTMLAMHRDGVITLPPPKGTAGPAQADRLRTGYRTAALFPAPTTLDEVRPLEMRIVVRGTREGSLWNEFVARYHYLGYKTPGRCPDALRRPRSKRLACSPCSASPPPRGSSLRATTSSDGHGTAAREEPSASWSTTRGS